jgi:hypothetical protein
LASELSCYPPAPTVLLSVRGEETFRAAHAGFRKAPCIPTRLAADLYTPPLPSSLS